MKSPRVAMLIWNFHPTIGGAEKQCQLLSKVLIEEGIPVFVVTARSEGLRSFETIDGIRVYRTFCLWKLRTIFKPVKNFILSHKITKKIVFSKSTTHATEKSNKGSKLLHIVQILILNPITHTLPYYSFMLSSLFFLWRKRGEYDIVHVHGTEGVVFVGVIIRAIFKKRLVIKKTIVGDSFIKKIPNRIKKTPIFVAISDEIKKELLSCGVEKDKIFECPNGVMIPSLNNIFPENSENHKYVTCVGNLSQQPNKGIDILLYAWKYVSSFNKEARLLIVGRKSHNTVLEIMARFLKIDNIVHFLGFVEDLSYYYRRTSVFVLPSRREGMSNALLEAMSFGLPCVATDISGNNDIIKDKINGLLVPEENPKALANGILYMLNNSIKAKQMGREARKTIKDKYEIHKITEQYVHLYMELMQAKCVE